MRKNIVLAATAVSMIALAIASPATAAKFQAHPNIIILSDGHDETNIGHQSGVTNPNSNPFQIGVNAAILSGLGTPAHTSSQSIEQTQSGTIVFPFLSPNQAGQVNYAGNLDLFSIKGNTQKITQNQNANVFVAFGPQIQRELGLNVAALGSGNNQTVDQTQNIPGALVTAGNVQQQAGVNAVVFGDNNTQSVKQTQTENALGAGFTTQQQLGANVVVVGSNNHQSVTQTQTDNSLIALGNQDTQVGANVIIGGSNNTQTVSEDQ